MVIFDDLQKLLLYQKLNLGFECHVCKRKFYNRLEQLQHTINCKSENLKCPKCNKTFGHQQILHLHLQFHNLSESPHSSTVSISENPVHVEGGGQLKSLCQEEATSANVEQSIGSIIDEDISLLNGNIVAVDVTEALHKEIEAQNQNSLVAPPKHQSSPRAKAKPKKPVKKKIGLTKIKMEDCLRCDECSCIYIDDRDYYKHMRNFHQRDMNNRPITTQQKTKRKCQSCCKQCRGGHCSTVRRPRASQLGSNIIFKINMRDNIKDRWSRMVSQQLTDISTAPQLDCTPEEVVVKPDPEAFTIKPDPDPIPDPNQLLEINIKKEPVDDYE